MPRGAKKDVPVTKLLFANGLFLDKRSFLGWRESVPHMFLKGADVADQRRRVWGRSKEKCASCKKLIWTFEMDHIQGGLSGRCDCLHNLQALCHECHAKKHISVQWSHGQL
jgi:hypothetical protein